MTHQRKTIRDAVVSILNTATIVASGKVYSNRELSSEVADLPTLNVFTLPEQSSPRDMTTKILKRQLDVTIELQATGTTDALTDDVIDGYADQIESALKADQTWSGTVVQSDLKSSEWTRDDKGGEASIGILRLKYQAVYFY